MKPDNPFSSGPGQAAAKKGPPEPAEVPAEEPEDEEEVIQPARSENSFRTGKTSVGGELPPLEMEEISCRTCQFFHFDEDSRVDAAEGECRYNAPTPGIDERAQWPIVEWNSWCGQWNTGISNDDMVKMARVVADRMTDPGAFND